jgi:uncharacterized membrane protein
MRIVRQAALRAFLRDRRANFAVMTALSVPFAVCLAAVAIDEGSLYTERREVQALADLAAITAAANIDKAETAAGTALRDNGLPAVAVSASVTAASSLSGGSATFAVVRGRYVADPSVAVASRFTPDAEPYNAVAVSVRRKGTLFFGGALMAPPTIAATAVASTSAEAAFSVGSRLAKVDGGMLNAVLGGLVGGSLSLSAMDYNALIASDVEVLSFLDALAVDLHLTAGTYDEVLDSTATVGQIAAALARTSGTSASNRLILQTIAGGATNTTAIPLSHLIDLGPVGRLALGQHGAGLPIQASAMSLLAASGALASGAHQVELDLGATIPGLTAARLAVAIGEPQQFSPWLAVGEAGTTVRTAQTRIRLTATVGIPNPALGGGTKLLSVELPLHVEVASAEAKLTAIGCPTGRPDGIRVSIAARPGVASLRLAESDASGFADFSKPQSFRDARIAEISLKLLLLSIDLLAVNGQASVAVTNTAATTLNFDGADIAAAKIKTVSTRNMTRSLTASLVDNLSLSVNVLGLGLDATALLGTVKPPVIALLTSVTEPVDALLYNTLVALGVGIGQADVRVTGATCGRAVLVQ